MANMDVDFGMQPAQRPRAIVGAYHRSQREEQPAVVTRAAPRPKFSRITIGQIVRALILVALCLGVVQLSHAEKAVDDPRAAEFGKRM
ncbi:hypothetical protein [Methylocystis parvus]|uniref:hypothetical protein n=1 Tax=Methylocystis parvus TaxID=134 RepID=UPI003C71EE3D